MFHTSRPGAASRSTSSGGHASPPKMSSRTRATPRWPQRREGGHGRHDRDPALHQPPAQLRARFHQRPGGGHQAGAVTPGEPHLLAGGVEGHRQTGQHPVAWPQWRGLEEHPGLGVDERRRRRVADRDALGLPGGPGGEDDPGVVRRSRRPQRPGRRAPARREPHTVAEHPTDVRLRPDRLRALGGVVGVDRNVGGPGREYREDPQVEVRGAGRHPHPDPVARADTAGLEHRRHPPDLGQQRAVGERRACVERGRVGVPRGGLLQDVEQRARPPGQRGAVDREVRGRRRARPGDRRRADLRQPGRRRDQPGAGRHLAQPGRCGVDPGWPGRQLHGRRVLRVHRQDPHRLGRGRPRYEREARPSRSESRWLGDSTAGSSAWRPPRSAGGSSETGRRCRTSKISSPRTPSGAQAELTPGVRRGPAAGRASVGNEGEHPVE